MQIQVTLTFDAPADISDACEALNYAFHKLPAGAGWEYRESLSDLENKLANAEQTRIDDEDDDDGIDYSDSRVAQAMGCATGPSNEPA